MYKISKLPDKERRELFSETASRMHTTTAIAEKDFWVVWVLGKLFSHKKLSRSLMFKGGTSLSMQNRGQVAITTHVFIPH